MARNLKECLAIQLAERDRLDPAMEVFIDNLELLASHDMARLKALCRVDMDDLADMVGGSARAQPQARQHVRLGGGAAGRAGRHRAPGPGRHAGRLNSTPKPCRGCWSTTSIIAEVASGTTRDSDKLYLSECMSNATWLVKSLDQRARTILAVAREIVRQQDAFLVHGVEHLRPLNLKTVADAISMHESTISRVTSNKYFETPRGIFELKYFFTTAISSSAGGEDHSAESVRHKIRNMIDARNRRAILSDDQIVDGCAQKALKLREELSQSTARP